MFDRNAKIAESLIAAAAQTSATAQHEIDQLRALVQRYAGFLDETEQAYDSVSTENGFMINDLRDWQEGRRPEKTDY